MQCARTSTTPSPPCPACQSPSYGLSKEELNRTAAANTTTYTAEDLCGAPASTIGWKTVGIINSGVMTDLESNTRYYYQVGDEVSKEGFLWRAGRWRGGARQKGGVVEGGWFGSDGRRGGALALCSTGRRPAWAAPFHTPPRL